uniref:Metallophos domain-containing protein n=1 Tax=Meloidogyne hapla TaxID=6305 RepID=A0A1I8BKU9_MELHA
MIITGDIHAFSQDFATLASPTIDWLHKFKNITEKTKYFLHLGGPAGALVALGLDMAFGEDSPEQKAIHNLHVDVIHKFKNLDITLQTMEGKILNEFKLEAYRNDVTNKMLDLESLYIFATNRYYNVRKHYKTSFIDACKTSGPKRILQGIEKLTVKECPTPHQSSEELYSQFLKIFFNIEKMIGKIELKPGFNEYQSAKFGQILLIYK